MMTRSRHARRRLALWLTATAASLGLIACAGGEASDGDDEDGDVMVVEDTAQGDTSVVPNDTSVVPTDTSTTSPGDTTMPGDTTTPDTGVPGDTTPTDTGTDTSPPGDTSPGEVDVPPGPTALGRACGVSSTCVPGTPSWPACASLVCEDGSCAFFGLGDQSFCTRDCETDADCANPDPGSVVGSSFKCVKDDTQSYCIPGSNAPCASSADCAGGEVCKIGLANGGGTLTVGTTCQTATVGGSSAGGSCNDDPQAGALQRCANDLCLGSRCSSFCGGGEACGTSHLECIQDVNLVSTGEVLRDLCLGRTCTSASQCTAPGYHCGSIEITGTPPNDFYTGRCLFTTLGDELTPLGGACSENDECESGLCWLDTPTSGTCSSWCSSDADCAATQKCGALVFGGLSDPDAVQPLLLCQNATGSRNACSGNPDCSGGEVCRNYLVGSLVGGDPFDLNGAPVTMCAAPVDPAGGDPGATCDANNGCKNDFCLTIQGETSSFCSAPCADDSDCPGSMLCTAPGGLVLYTRPSGADITVPVCVPP